MTHLSHRLGISWPVLKASVHYLHKLRVQPMAQFFVIFEKVNPHVVYFKWPLVFNSREEAFLEIGKQLRIVYDLDHPV